MSFTTPCFIRKNTPELREYLSDLGYKQLRCSEDGCLVTGLDLVSSIRSECFDNKDPMRTWDTAGRIDCGDDEDLFITLAAMRDDTDYMQWFTNGTDFIKCEREDWPDMYSVLCSGRGKEYMNELDKYHKATPTEIIAHFKQKE